MQRLRQKLQGNLKKQAERRKQKRKGLMRLGGKKPELRELNSKGNENLRLKSRKKRLNQFMNESSIVRYV